MARRVLPILLCAFFLVHVALGEAKANKQPPKKPAPPASSPTARDGMIAFVSDRDGSEAIWAVPGGGGAAQELTHPDPDNGETDSSPAFSPDGKQLIFVRQNVDGGSDLWIAAADGSHPHKLIGDILDASFSPDGKQLVVVVPTADDNNAIALVPSSGGKPTIICSDSDGAVNSPVFSPDGKQLAYSDDGRGILIATLTGKVNCQAALLGTIGSGDPSYGPDGSIAWDDSNSDQGGTDIWIKQPGKAKKTIVADGSGNVSPVIAPAGDKIVFSSDRPGDGTQVYTARLDGSGVRSIGDPQQSCSTDYCQGDSAPAWQPLR